MSIAKTARTPAPAAVAMKRNAQPQSDVVATQDTTQPSAPDPQPASLAEVSDAHLKRLATAVREETKRREKLREASRPQRGDQVVITAVGHKLKGKKGEVVISRKTRCFVDVPGVSNPLYLLHTQVERVTNEEEG